MRRIILSLIVVVVALGGPTSHVALSQIPGGVLVGVAVNGIFSRLDQSVDKAMEQGNYQVANAAMQIKDALEKWKSVNSDLLDKAFQSLDPRIQEIFNKADAWTANTQSGVGQLLESARGITDSANQVVESIPLARRTYVLRYGPRLIVADTKQPLPLVIRGVNLDGADPQVTFQDKQAKRISLTQLEAQFAVDFDGVVEQRVGKRHEVTVVYTTESTSWLRWLLGRRDNVRRELSIVVLPKVVATFDYSSKIRSVSEESKEFTANLGQFQGKNTRIYRIAKPPEGYLWDLKKPLNLVQGPGESARCEGIDMNQSTGSGVTMFARVDEKRDMSTGGGIFSSMGIGGSGDGYVGCSLHGTVFHQVTKVEDGPSQSGELTWSGDVPLPRADNTVEMKLIVRTFDGRERTVTGDDSDKLFRVKVAAGSVIISPNRPPEISE